MKSAKKTAPSKIGPQDQINNQITELKEKLARSLADYSNLEKRIENQRQMYVTLATVSIVSKMISVLDDLYLSSKHLKDQGLDMTISKFVAVLKSEGLAEVDTSSGVFNPATMECIGTTEGEDNKIISVEKKGYLLNEQIIRPAQVIVGKSNDSNEPQTPLPDRQVANDQNTEQPKN